MPLGRPKTTLELSDEERLQLSTMAKSRTLPHSLVARAKVVLPEFCPPELLSRAAGDGGKELARLMREAGDTFNEYLRKRRQ